MSPHAAPDIAPVLLIGAGGMLGRAWRRLLEARRLPCETLDAPAFDLTDPAAVEAAVQPRHRTVINCAAWTDVDGCESPEQYDAALALNATAVGTLADRCRAVDATLLHYSTDYVFNGRATTPYPTDAPRDPVNAYGRTKAQGEALLEVSACRYLLVRTSWLYAPWGKNFVRTIANAARQRDALRVVNDQRGRPTSAEHLAATSLRLIEASAHGAYHVCDGGDCTWFDFARHIAATVNPACRVDPCPTSEYPLPANRPAYSVLDLTTTEALLGPMGEWRRHLDSVLDRIDRMDKIDGMR